jgi:predicted lysophospholipase L1 biosynthesis ABC-type transport system permease subunit
VPGVLGIAFARGLGYTWTEGPVTLPLGRTRGDTVLEANVRPVSPGFFGVLRIPVAAGREFTEQDRPGTPLVAVVTSALAGKLWPHGSAVGQAFTLGGKAFQVVGVVADYTVRTATDAPAPIVAIPYWQNAFGPEVDARMAIRVRGDPEAVLPQLRRAVNEVDPAVPVTEVLSMEAQVGLDNTPIRLGGSVLMAASAVALFLTGLGLYGVIAFIVQQRTREIGVRIAVGATSAQIVSVILRQGVGAAVLGGAAGLGVALLSARLLGAFLVGVDPWDMATFAIATASVLAAALVASYLPARRAARLDPMTALRAE